MYTDVPWLKILRFVVRYVCRFRGNVPEIPGIVPEIRGIVPEIPGTVLEMPQVLGVFGARNIQND